MSGPAVESMSGIGIIGGGGVKMSEESDCKRGRGGVTSEEEEEATRPVTEGAGASTEIDV